MSVHLSLEKNYTPKDVEGKWYETWVQNDLFSASSDSSKTPYTIVIPPPNVTGSLHMGHALDNTLQDILIRAKRMMGFEALWIPGTDHAGIATQKKVEDHIKKEGLNRFTLGREAFVKRVWEWKELYGNTIISQFKRLGLSCDWNRLRFTLDDICSKAVKEAFYRLYKKGLIYKGRRLINWCPKCLTALSDLEVEHENNASKLYYLRYFAPDKKSYITIATTRPETILADVAVCVNPEDERYLNFIGKEVVLPLTDRKLPVIPDFVVDPAFGTGALKITPAHDPTDYEVGQKYNLEQISIIDETGKMNELAGKYAGLDRFKCRELIVEDLRNEGFLEKEEDYSNSVGHCYRCNTIIEPFLSWQWFVKMAQLAAPALEAEKEGKIKFYPKRYADVYKFWLENIRDWCISRQLWWGHRIPIWTCGKCENIDAYKEDCPKCSKCGSDELVQEDDVLDTWFSSGIWPLSTLGWPEDTKDLNFFYPTNVLVTARDIIFLWVARMIMTGLEFKGEVPFADVHIHATVLAKDRRRMSKSLGTGVDPLELIDKYGADALRFALTYMTAQGQDIVYSEERVEMARNFANKIWNAARFCLSHIPENKTFKSLDEYDLEPADKWILTKLNETLKKVTYSFDDYSFDVTASSLYNFFWDDFCDWYIEIVKRRLTEKESEEFIEKTSAVFLYVFSNFLRLLHPVMPFITEELWHMFDGNKGFVIKALWPEYNEILLFDKESEDMLVVFETVKGIRSLRADVQLPPKKKIIVYIQSDDKKYIDLITTNQTIIKDLAGLEDLILSKDKSDIPEKSITVMVGINQIFLPALEIEDLAKQIERIEKDIQKAKNEIDSIDKKFSNESFMKNAKPEVIEMEKARFKQAEMRFEKLSAQAGILKSI